jgi:hypothetical protein
MYDSLPKNEKTFDVEVVGETTGFKYTGQFTVTCILDMAGKHQLELEKTRLMADYANPSRGLFGIATSLATIRTKIVSSPDWWKNADDGASIKDENLIFTLYDKCNEMETQWRKELKDLSTEAVEETQASTEEKKED